MKLTATVLFGAMVFSAASLASPWEPGAESSSPVPDATSKPPEPEKRRRHEEPAPSDIHFSLRLLPGFQVGATSASFSIPVAGSSATLSSSQLDWPLNAFVLGTQIKVGSDGGRWAVTAAFSTNIGDPFGTLTTHEWSGKSSEESQIAQLDSGTSGQFLTGDATARYQFSEASFRDAELKVDALLGYRHEAFFADAWGATGWAGTTDAKSNVAISSKSKLAHEEFQRALPHVGVGVRSRLFERLQMDVEAQFVVGISADQIDHRYNSTIGTSTTAGVGLLVACAPRWVLLENQRSGMSVSIGADFQVRLTETSGTIKQHFHVNSDPALPSPSVQFTIPDAPVSYTSALGSLLVSADVVF